MANCEEKLWFLTIITHLLYVLCNEASSNFLVTGDEEESLGLGGTLGLHLLEAEVTVHHLSDLLHLPRNDLNEVYQPILYRFISCELSFVVLPFVL